MASKSNLDSFYFSKEKYIYIHIYIYYRERDFLLKRQIYKVRRDREKDLLPIDSLPE